MTHSPKAFRGLVRFFTTFLGVCIMGNYVATDIVLLLVFLHKKSQHLKIAFFEGGIS